MEKSELTIEMYCPEEAAAVIDTEVEWHPHDTMGEATTARGRVRMIGLEREGGRLP